jgi:erythrin-vacuolar iron transport family protein
MTSKLDFAKLSLQDALDIAIIIEEEARDRYEELAEQLEQHRTPDAAKFFRAMVKNESKHAVQLQTHRKKVFGQAPVKVDRSIVPEVETTDYDEARAFMTPHQALRVALANEVRAHNFYAGALKKVKDAKVKDLFKELVQEEKEHQTMVKNAIAKLPREDKSNPDDFGDEPVAQ